MVGHSAAPCLHLRLPGHPNLKVVVSVEANDGEVRDADQDCRDDVAHGEEAPDVQPVRRGVGADVHSAGVKIALVHVSRLDSLLLCRVTTNPPVVPEQRGQRYCHGHQPLEDHHTSHEGHPHDGQLSSGHLVHHPGSLHGEDHDAPDGRHPGHQRQQSVEPGSQEPCDRSPVIEVEQEYRDFAHHQ